jgi:hypothetical protein
MLTGRRLENAVGNARSFDIVATDEKPVDGAESFGFVSEKNLFDLTSLGHQIFIFPRKNDVFSFDRGHHMGLF